MLLSVLHCSYLLVRSERRGVVGQLCRVFNMLCFQRYCALPFVLDDVP